VSSCEPCLDAVPAYLQGSFALTLQRDGEDARDIGNVVIGTLQDEVETFFGCPADGSEMEGQTAYQVRSTVNLIVSADEITCENLLMWLQGPMVNVPGGQRILLSQVLRRDPFRAVATRDLCNGAFLSIVLHRAFIVTPVDILFQSGVISANQFTLRATRDPNNPTHPYGYLELSPSDCALS
jgi:hypothetical protein